MAALGILFWAAVVCGPLPAAAVQKGTETAEDQLKFGIKMAQRGLWSEARFRFLRAKELSPGDQAVLNNLAVASEALGLFDEALGYYRAALEIDPNNKNLRQNYARFVEFYQSFRPQEPEAAGQEGAEAEADPEPEPSPAEALEGDHRK